MTSTKPYVARPAAPGSIVLVRVLAVVQLVLGLLTSATLGFLAVLALAWTSDDGSGPDAVAIGVTAIFALALTLTITLACLAGRLRAGAERVRIALVVIESAIVAGMLALLPVTASTGSLYGLVAAPMLYLGCAAATAIALLQPSARAWSADRARRFA